MLLKILQRAQDAPTAENDLAPNVCSAKKENPCLRFRNDRVFSSFSILG